MFKKKEKLYTTKKQPKTKESNRQEAERKSSYTSRHHCIQKPSRSAQC